MIGLSSLSLDSYISIQDAAGISIKDLLFLVWTKKSFAIGNTREFQSKLRQAKKSSRVSLDLNFVQWGNDIKKIEFYNDSLVIADSLKLSVWKQNTLASLEFKDLETFAINPEFKPDLCATLTSNGQVSFCYLAAMKRVDLACNNATCITWSRRGKQIACGTKNGEILFYNSDAQLKNTISRPEKVSESYHIQYIEWLEDRSFLVLYASKDKDVLVFQILQDKDSVFFKFNVLEAAIVFATRGSCS